MNNQGKTRAASLERLSMGAVPASIAGRHKFTSATSKAADLRLDVQPDGVRPLFITIARGRCNNPKHRRLAPLPSRRVRAAHLPCRALQRCGLQTVRIKPCLQKPIADPFHRLERLSFRSVAYVHEHRISGHARLQTKFAFGAKND